MVAVSRSTGEVTQAITYIAPCGTISYTPEQQERYKERTQRKLEEEQATKYTRRHFKGEPFFFAARQTDYSDLDPAIVARLIYLATYLDYDGMLIRSQKCKILTRRDLPEVLKLSAGAVSQFMSAVNGKYVTEDEQGNLGLVGDFFHKGTITRSIDYQRFYINAVRELYQQTDTRQHKNLGRIFKLLPYINIEFNALCHNPEETEFEKIDYMTPNEFCIAAGYSIGHWDRLRKDYDKLTFNTKTGKQVFCAFVTIAGIVHIYINPNVLYKGHHVEEVSMLANEFTMCCQKRFRHSVKQ